MMKWVGFIGLGLIYACGSTKAAIQKTLKTPDTKEVSIDTVKVDSIKLEQILDTPSIQASPKNDIVTDPELLTPEQKLAFQKLDGINRQTDWAPAIHYDNRKPNYVIIHHTSQNSVAQTVRTFQVPHSKVSAHYVIGRNGQVIQMLNDYDRAWHAGKSKWGTITDINSISLGIELDNNGFEPFPDEQIDALLILLDTLKSKYNIPQLNFIGHGDVAPTRKDDPNIHFPWKKLADRGFGIWYNEDFLETPPATFNPIDAMKIMGYDMSKPEAAIRAFKRKFIGKSVNGVLNSHDIAVLYDLYRKYY